MLLANRARWSEAGRAIGEIFDPPHSPACFKVCSLLSNPQCVDVTQSISGTISTRDLRLKLRSTFSAIMLCEARPRYQALLPTRLAERDCASTITLNNITPRHLSRSSRHLLFRSSSVTLCEARPTLPPPFAPPYKHPNNCASMLMHVLHPQTKSSTLRYILNPAAQSTW